MSDRFKIEVRRQNATRLHSWHSTFCIAIIKDTLQPLTERKDLLSKVVSDGPRMAISDIRRVAGQTLLILL